VTHPHKWRAIFENRAPESPSLQSPPWRTDPHAMDQSERVRFGSAVRGERMRPLHRQPDSPRFELTPSGRLCQGCARRTRSAPLPALPGHAGGSRTAGSSNCESSGPRCRHSGDAAARDVMCTLLLAGRPRRVARSPRPITGVMRSLDAGRRRVAGATTALDIGSGNGLLSSDVAAQGLQVVGICPDEASIERARSDPDCSDRTTFLHGDVFTYPLGPAPSTS
jgi:hypothetical protein